MEQQAKDERRKAAEAEEESVDTLKARIEVLEHTVLLCFTGAWSLSLCCAIVLFKVQT